MPRKRIDPELLAEWTRQRAEMEDLLDRRKAREREVAELEARRRARLRRLTFGLLGR